MKSAYELALERMESQGIERPREDALTDAQRQEVQDIRSKADAKIAELEILHRKATESPDTPPEQRAQAEAELKAEVQRVEERRDAQIRKLRQKS